MKTFDKTMAAIGVVISGLFAIIVIILIRGFILVKLWSWFIVSTFKAPEIKIAQALGISIVMSYILDGLTTEKKKGFEVITTPIVSGLVTLGLGWIVFQFI